MSTEPMMCPYGHGRMNHHCDKALDPRCREDAEHFDAVLHGTVKAVFECPVCGLVQARLTS